MGYGTYVSGLTHVYFYDDNDATGGHAVGQPHTLEEMILSPVCSPYVTKANNAFLSTRILRAGDAVSGHSNTTTFQSTTSETLNFDGGTFNTATQNQAGVVWRIGQKVGSGEAVAGHSGLQLVGGTTHTLRGTILLYGSTWRCGNILAFPFDGSATDSEMVGNHFQLSSSAGMAVGGSGVGYFKQAAKNKFIRTASGAPVVSVVYANDVFGNEIIHAGDPTGIMVQTTVNLMRMKHIKFATSAGTVPAQFGFGTPQNWFLVEPEWVFPEKRKFAFSLSATQLINGKQHCEYWGLNLTVLGSAAEPLQGIPVRFSDILGVQVDVLTDASGGITYGYDWQPLLPLSGNYVIVDDIGNWEYAANEDYSRRYRGPFLLEVNSGPNRNQALPTRRFLFEWPYTGSSRKTGQYHPVRAVVNLGSVGGIPADWTECTVT